MEEILNEIGKADANQIHILLDAVMARFRILLPEWDTGTISIRKSNDIEDEINRSIALLESIKSVSIKEGSLKQSMGAGVDSIHLDA